MNNMKKSPELRNWVHRQRTQPLSFTAGAMSFATSDSSPEMNYHFYWPQQTGTVRRLLIVVHGVSRNAEEQMALLQPWADRYGVALLAPVFSKAVFRDYQRLGRRQFGPRADLALIRVLNEVGRQCNLNTSRVDLFGFSGGAQFAHRFAFAYPQRVRRLVLGAAGWYTMPDEGNPYPYGTGSTEGLSAVRFHLLAASRIPTLVVVGELDNQEDDEELNRSNAVLAGQGKHRLARAISWVDAMNAYARKRGSGESACLSVLPGIGHSFRDAVLHGKLLEQLCEHCYDSPEASLFWSRKNSATRAAQKGLGNETG